MASIISDDNSGDRPVLILGASGRLGRMLCAHWPDARNLRLQSRSPGPGMTVCDPLADPERLAALAEGCACVICLWGVTPARANAEGDAMHLNVDLARIALRAAPVRCRVFALSTAAVYGAQPGLLDEDAPLSPLSEYARSKIEMEQMMAWEGAGRGHVLRVGNVAGADAVLGGWRPGMRIDQLAGGGTPRRSYIGPRSLARVFACLCHAPDVPDILNIAAPGPVEMGDLLDAAGRDWSPRPAGEDVIAEVSLDTTRLERLYAFAPDECTARGMVLQLDPA